MKLLRNGKTSTLQQLSIIPRCSINLSVSARSASATISYTFKVAEKWSSRAGMFHEALRNERLPRVFCSQTFCLTRSVTARLSSTSVVAHKSDVELRTSLFSSQGAFVSTPTTFAILNYLKQSSMFNKAKRQPKCNESLIRYNNRIYELKVC